MTRRSSWPLRGEDPAPPMYRIAIQKGNQVILVEANKFAVVDRDTYTANSRTRDFQWEHLDGLVVQPGLGRLDPVLELTSSWKVSLVSIGLPDVSAFRDALPKGTLSSLLDASEDPGTESCQLDIYAQFVARPVTEFSPWVLAESGTVRGVLQAPDSITIILDESPDLVPLPSEQMTREDQLSHALPAGIPRDMMLQWAMVAMLLVWVLRGADFLFFRGQDDPGSYAVFRLLSDPSLPPGFETAMPWFIFTFLILHHLRMALGVEFASRDSSFTRAKLNYDRTIRRQKAAAEVLVLSIVVFFSTLLTFFVSLPHPALALGCLFLQSVLIMLYDWIMQDAFVRFDPQRAANGYILRADLTLTITTSVMLAAVLWDWFYEQPFFVAGINVVIVLFLIIGFIFLTIFEVAKSYLQSLSAGWKELKAILRKVSWRSTIGARRSTLGDSLRLWILGEGQSR